ncbi:MAG: 3-phosphoshikimate 1-carboxyvinyltransferase [Saprospiraceae bacterium]|nr:3-phosphoshikimate 1-carboxyvinyltransferase [Saprospiraceae bacterium]
MLLYKPDRHLSANIQLDGSKSISNRALIALALAGANPADYLSRLSTSRDTTTLLRLLQQPADATLFDAGDAGTTFRFMTAYLAMQPGKQLLTGSHRMLQRPVGPLVAALRELGADIEFAGETGYPPLQIGEWHLPEHKPVVHIEAGTSSQFLSALLLIAPYLPQGLELVPTGRLVSRPYLDMTLRLMRYFGASASWEGESIVVAPGRYTPRQLEVEADWSAASYWYAMAAFAEKAEVNLHGLFKDSWQGDAALVSMMQRLGVETDFHSTGIRLYKAASTPHAAFEQDFLECPDIAQTLAVVCGGLGLAGLFSGLETLSIKETDRIEALRQELKKTGVAFVRLPAHLSKKSPGKTFYLVEGKAQWNDNQPPEFATYGDHRMAMAFAPLAMLHPVSIQHPEVVSKSYPSFWNDLESAGFVIS